MINILRLISHFRQHLTTFTFIQLWNSNQGLYWEAVFYVPALVFLKVLKRFSRTPILVPLKTSKCSFFWPVFNLAPSLCSFCSFSDLLQPVIFLNSIHFSVPCSVPWPVFQIQADGWEWSNFLQETAMVHRRPPFGRINLVNHKCGHKINNVRAAESSRFYWKICYLPIK